LSGARASWLAVALAATACQMEKPPEPSASPAPPASTLVSQSAGSPPATDEGGSADVLSARRPTDEECPATACGPRLGLPNRQCSDGVHFSGPTGRCIKKDGGVCGWEIAHCP
jgi:hypothetical protein